MTAVREGSIFAPLMWPQLQDEVISALLEAFCSEGKSKEGLY